MDTQDYISAINLQLHDTKLYQPIDHSTATKNSESLTKILKHMSAKTQITPKELSFLLPPATIKHRTFYGLPKTHKPLNKWNYNLLQRFILHYGIY